MNNATLFSLGSDARFRGEPISACPFEPCVAAAWRAGWRSVDREWGLDVTRWPVRRLPPVRGREENAA